MQKAKRFNGRLFETSTNKDYRYNEKWNDWAMPSRLPANPDAKLQVLAEDGWRDAWEFFESHPEDSSRIVCTLKGKAYVAFHDRNAREVRGGPTDLTASDLRGAGAKAREVYVKPAFRAGEKLYEIISGTRGYVGHEWVDDVVSISYYDPESGEILSKSFSVDSSGRVSSLGA